VSLLAAGRYDLVVLDQNMPEMSGLDVVRDLKYSRLAAGAAIMIVTSAADKVLIDAIRTEDLPVASLVAKPFTLDTFRQKHDKVVGQPGRAAPKGADDPGPNGETGQPRHFAGQEVMAKVVVEEAFVGIAFKGRPSYADRFLLKRCFDQAMNANRCPVAVNLAEAEDFDEFFVGFFLMFAGTLAGMGRQVYLITGGGDRVSRLGVDRIVETYAETADFYRLIGYGEAAASG